MDMYISTAPVYNLHDSIWQNVDLNKIAKAIAYRQLKKIFSYINRFQKLKPPYWVITQSQF